MSSSPLFIPGGTAEQMQWFNDLQRMTASPENAVRIRRALDDIDVSDLLPRVAAPTLVDIKVDGRRIKAVAQVSKQGFTYVFEWADEVKPKDTEFSDHGVAIVVDPKSLVYLGGMTLDFVRGMMGHGFKFNNPNAKGSCGCGESVQF